MNINQAHAFINAIEKYTIEANFKKPIEGFSDNPQMITQQAEECITILREKKDSNYLEKLENALIVYSKGTKSSKICAELITNIQNIRQNVLQQLKDNKSQEKEKKVKKDEEQLLSFIPKEIRGIIAEYASNGSSITPFNVDELINRIDMFCQDSSMAKNVWKGIAKELNITDEKLNKCKDTKEIIELIKEKIALPLLSICTRFEDGDDFLRNIHDLPLFEKAKRVDTWIRTNPNAKKGPTILDFSGLGLELLPAAIFVRPFVRILNLKNNNFTKLPTEINQFIDLLSLNVERNQLKDLPDLSNLTSLMTLQLNNNKLTKIPHSVSQLKQLMIFFASNNQIQEITILCNLENLQRIYISRTKILEFPIEIEKLKKLDRLEIYGNPDLVISDYLLERQKQGLLEIFK